MTLTNIVMVNAVCYENFKGEKYLAYLGYEDKAKLEEKIEEINRNKTNKLPTGEVINWDKVKRFFVEEQEDFF